MLHIDYQDSRPGGFIKFPVETYKENNPKPLAGMFFHGLQLFSK